MELAELLEVAREEIDDEVQPYLWSDKQLVRYLNEAMREAAIRARLLVESADPAICQVSLVAGQAAYALHPSIIVIRRGVLASDPSMPLHRTTSAALDGAWGCRDWRTQAGPPAYLVNDQQGGGKTLLVSPVPATADTLQLTVLRYPTELEQLDENDPTGEPPFEAQHHEKLVHWAAFRALMKRDAEQEATADARDQLALFEAYFGPRPTALKLQQLATEPVTGTQPVYF